MDRIATFHVVRERRGRQLVVMVRMLTDRWRLRGVDGLLFAKVLGTGRGENTAPSVDLRRQAYFLVWRDVEAARSFLDGHPVARRFRSLDVERDLVLALVSGHGTWSGRPILDGMRRVRADGEPARQIEGVPGVETASDTASETASETAGEVVVVTRARIRLRSWRSFRRASRRTAGARPAGRCWALGVGELPVGLLGTVSCWRSSADLAAWLSTDTAHADAAARGTEWFVESLFARFAPCEPLTRSGPTPP